MREILCKGKRINRNEWYEGFYCELPCEDGSKVPSILFVDEEKNVMIQMPIAPETVSRWTGKNGKNGVKIFEGDIVKLPNKKIGYVRYSEDCAMYTITFKDYDEADFTEYYGKDIEVIGNKWDNPELLERS